MASRMEKYYNSETVKKRIQKNQSLYRQMYDIGEYSNIEAVESLDRTNEIDITKVKQMLQNREEYKRQKQYRSLLNQEEEKEPLKKELKVEEVKNYDIKDELEKLKNQTRENDEYRSLNNTNYNILKELKIKSEQQKEFSEDDAKELKELINTITSTSLLNKLDNEELSLNMLGDLAKDENEKTMPERASIESILEEAKALDKKKEDKPSEIDNSFYTSSLDFNKKDFEDLYEQENKKKSKNLKLILTVTGIVLVIFIALVLIILKFIK